MVKKQRDFFNTGKTLPLNYRIDQLKLLYDTIKKYEVDIALALKSDLGKSSFESYMCEIGLVLSEITYMLKNIRKFAAKHKVPTPLSQYDAVSYKQACPYGNVLIMSPWNYPFLLTLDPLVDAMAAGNTAIVKPSAYSPATSQIIEKIVEECFPPEYVSVITGGRAENTSLLQQKFDFIFFTGSQAVGKEVLHSAAEYITPVVLELGGKSPCIVDDTAKIRLAAKRIVFGKFLNCGQTCVAPDYVLCQEDIASQLVDEICKEVKLQYTDKPLENSLYGNIINEKHFDRISGLIDKKKVVLGGDTDAETMQIEPTVMTEVTWDDAVMQQEIFGPVLPILTFDKFEDVFEILKDRPKPLALYLFSENKGHIKAVIEKCRYGGGCINDTVIHLASSEMGFGGVGESGMGSYHGKEGFEAFSHTKSIVNKKTWIDLPMRYQPYKEKYRKIVNFFLK